MTAEERVRAAGWFRCIGGEFTKIIGDKQIACNSAESALAYDEETRADAEIAEVRAMADRDEPLPESVYIDQHGEVQLKPGRSGVNDTRSATGYIEPSNLGAVADYWVTRRSADAAPGYGHDLPDLRARYRWNGNGFWVTGYHLGRRGRETSLSGLHSNNGWRIEGPAQ